MTDATNDLDDAPLKDNLRKPWSGEPGYNAPQSSKLDEILELVFWAGQHNAYPATNSEPEMSAAQAKSEIKALMLEIIGPDMPEITPVDEVTLGINAHLRHQRKALDAL